MAKPWSSLSSLNVDCRWFKGDVPCSPHKLHGVHCIDEQGHVCEHYGPITSDILIIKLGAVGDIIRTTPLLRRLKELYPQARIWWLTHTPEVVPKIVDVVLRFTPQSLAIVTATYFDMVFNLEKDREACALLSTLSARIKKGFTLNNGMPVPIDSDAEGKYMTGVFDHR